MDKEMKNELAVTNTSTNEIVLYQPNETIQLGRTMCFHTKQLVPFWN